MGSACSSAPNEPEIRIGKKFDPAHANYTEKEKEKIVKI